MARATRPLPLLLLLLLWRSAKVSELPGASMCVCGCGLGGWTGVPLCVCVVWLSIGSVRVETANRRAAITLRAEPLPPEGRHTTEITHRKKQII